MLHSPRRSRTCISCWRVALLIRMLLDQLVQPSLAQVEHEFYQKAGVDVLLLRERHPAHASMCGGDDDALVVEDVIPHSYLIERVATAHHVRQFRSRTGVAHRVRI